MVFSSPFITKIAKKGFKHVALGYYFPGTHHCEQGREAMYPEMRKALELLSNKDPATVEFFAEQLSRLLFGGLSQFIMTTVPANMQADGINPMALVMRQVADKTRNEYTELFKKTYMTLNLKDSTEDYDDYYSVLTLIDPLLVKDKIILIGDQSERENIPFAACRKLLLEAGAKAVLTVSLAKQYASGYSYLSAPTEVLYAQTRVEGRLFKDALRDAVAKISPDDFLTPSDEQENITHSQLSQTNLKKAKLPSKGVQMTLDPWTVQRKALSDSSGFFTNMQANKRTYDDMSSQSTQSTQSIESQGENQSAHCCEKMLFSGSERLQVFRFVR